MIRTEIRRSRFSADFCATVYSADFRRLARFYGSRDDVADAARDFTAGLCRAA